MDEVNPNVPETPVPRAYVAVGASAGGVEAIRSLVQAIPNRSGLAFIILQHMARDSKSAMATIAQDWTTVTVQAATDQAPIEADHIYFIPPGIYPEIRNGRFVFLNSSHEHGHHPIDFLLRSLAADQHRCAASVILSGTGDDGALGTREIKAGGGLTIAEDPAVARFDAMPRAALEKGGADLTLSPALIPAAIMDFLDHSVEHSKQSLGDDTDLARSLDAILEKVSTDTGHDFRGYKKTTARRRLERRMTVRQADTFDAYLELLQSDPEEPARLASELLINVTGFFRDHEAYELLENEVVPLLFADKPPTEPIRAWVAGCATGEEAYSIAMLLFEYRESARVSNPIQIFASDIDEGALDAARLGIYAQPALAATSQERVARFFTQIGPSYRVAKDLREAIVFSLHNMITDPPFSRLDLVVCRNVLIYLEPDTQHKLMGNFAFVLKKGGFLFLGSSETIGKFEHQYETISKQWRIFRSLGPPRRGRVAPPEIAANAISRLSEAMGVSPTMKLTGIDRPYRHILEQYGPATVLTNHLYEVVFTRGPIKDYVDLPAGEPSYDLFAMLKTTLRSAVRTLANRALTDGKLTFVTTTRMDEHTQVRITAMAVSAIADEELLLLSFEQEPAVTQELPPVSPPDKLMVAELEQELQATRTDLQRTVEQARISTEELKALNEESVAMNEELQSANEELESSKEELQSLNEELLSANSALDTKVAELQALNDDLTNLFSSTDIGTLFLDTNYRIKRFTPAATHLMRLIPGDIGRPVTDIAHDLQGVQILDGAPEVMQTLKPFQVEVRDRHQRWYIKRVLPYFSGEGQVTGVVMTFTDVSSLKAVQRSLEALASRLQKQAQLLEQAHVFARNLEDEIVFWNKGAENLYGWTAAEAMGRISHELLCTQFPVPIVDVMKTVQKVGEWRGDLVHYTKTGRPIVVASHWVLARDETGRPWAIVEINNDITERKTFEQRLLDSHKTLDFLEHHDPLTQLPNRMLFRDRVEHAISSSQGMGGKFAVLFLDLDRFKNINDSLGHDVGDQLLVQTTRRLQDALPEKQTLARLGGDEFGVLLEGIEDIAQISHTAGCVIDAMSTAFSVKGHELFIGVSIGISVFPGDAEDPDSLLRNADAAMYLAKHKGRNNYQFFLPELNEQAHRHLAVENRLRRALERNELTLVYQPQVDIQSQRIVGAEALARWHNPELGHVAPQEFISIAEDSNLIGGIGEWTLSEVCRQVRAWQQAGLHLSRVAVNISPLHFLSPNFLGTLTKLLDEFDIPPSKLELELTERIMMEDAEHAIALFGNLKGIGVQLSIDDFGTGYSSLHYLSHLPLDHLKVAREFIPVTLDGSEKAVVSRAIVALARSLNLHCTVEGIESTQQLEFFKELGCDTVQGYLYSRPLSVEQMEALLRADQPLQPQAPAKQKGR